MPHAGQWQMPAVLAKAGARLRRLAAPTLPTAHEPPPSRPRAGLLRAQPGDRAGHGRRLRAGHACRWCAGRCRRCSWPAVALARGDAERWRAPPAICCASRVLGALGMGFCAYAAFEAARTTAATNIGLIYGCTSGLRRRLGDRRRAAARRRRRCCSASPPALPASSLILTRGHPEVLLRADLHAGRPVGGGRHARVRRLHGGHAPHAGNADAAAAVRGDEPRRHAGAAAVRGRRDCGAPACRRSLCARCRGLRRWCCHGHRRVPRLQHLAEAQRAGADLGLAHA